MSLLQRALKAGSFDEIMPGWASPPSGYIGKSGTGVVVTVDGALSVSVIFRCISLLSETLAKLPLQLYRDRPDAKGRDRAVDRPEYPVLHTRPNPTMTSFTWRQTTMVHLLTWGNSYSEIVRDGFGTLLELRPLRPDRMDVRWENDQRVYYYTLSSGERERLPQNRVFHVPGLGFDGLIGYSPVALMRETIGSYGAAREYGAGFFKNGARPAVVVTHPKTMSDLAVERLGAQMDRLRGSGNSGKTVIIEEGGDFKDLGFPPEDAQFIQTKDHELAEFARWYGVPPHMVGLVDRSTSWGTGIEEQTLGFLTFTMDSHLVNFEQNIEAQLLWGTDVKPEFTRDALLRMDGLKRAQKLDIERRNGVRNADEWRALENLNPLPDGLGESYLRPVTMTVVTPDGATTRTELEAVTGRSEPVVTTEQVQAKRAELIAVGKPAGVRSIADALSVSPTTVWRRLNE